jgi:hypothetical protein
MSVLNYNIYERMNYFHIKGDSSNIFKSPKCKCEIKGSTFKLNDGTICCCKCELER